LLAIERERTQSLDTDKIVDAFSAAHNYRRMVGESFSRHYMDCLCILKAACDSVDRPALWLLLRSLGIPPKIFGLIRELYTGTLSCSVRMEGIMSDWFQLKRDVIQGCTIASSLFYFLWIGILSVLFIGD